MPVYHCFSHVISRKQTAALSAAYRRDHFCAACQLAVKKREHATTKARCKFESFAEVSYCSLCAVNHPTQAFSPKQSRQASGRICIAGEGYVSLCQHVRVTLKEIEDCLRGLQVPLDEVQQLELKRCMHADHLHKCKKNPSYPTASLLSYVSGDISLLLEWNAHAGPISSVPGSLGRYLAKDIRDLAKQFRIKGAHYILPERRAGHVPEMESFPLSQGCDCIVFDTELNASMGRCPEPTTSHCQGLQCGRPHDTSANRYRDAQVSLHHCHNHCQKDERQPACIEFRYFRIVSVGDLTGDTIPNHAWYHALDRDSYAWDGLRGLPESCNDISCSNVYMSTAEGRGCYENIRYSAIV